jgi:hypothetical protein
MDEEDETAVVFHSQRLGAGAISVVAVAETHAVIHEAILTNGEVTMYPKRVRKETFREGVVEGVAGVEVEVAGAGVVVSTKVAAALLVIKIPLSTMLVP